MRQALRGLKFIVLSLRETVPAVAVYDRKFVPLYDDRQAGGTTPLSAWTVRRSQKGSESMLVIDPTAVHCDCCSTYKG